MSYIVCISNKGYEVSLEPRKLYKKLRDPASERHGLVRVLDESGEDYLFPADHFTPIDVPQKIKRQLDQIAA